MNNEKLQAAKDQAAREIGYPNYQMAATLHAAPALINRAMEIYAEIQSKQFAEWIALHTSITHYRSYFL